MRVEFTNIVLKHLFEIRDIVMDKSNPMSVDYYSMKVEFQGRGAAHNHGVLWVNLKKLEYSIKDQTG